MSARVRVSLFADQLSERRLTDSDRAAPEDDSVKRARLDKLIKLSGPDTEAVPDFWLRQETIGRTM